MNGFIIFIVGAAASMVSEALWKGNSRWYMALWGGLGMLLLRRVMLRFPCMSKALLCLFGALLLTALGLVILILRGLFIRTEKNDPIRLTEEMPSFLYGLYRFLLIAPAYTIIEYLEVCFRM